MYLPAPKVLLSGIVLTLLWCSHRSAWAAPSVGLIDFTADGGDFTVVSTNNPGGPWTYDFSAGSWAAYDTDSCAVPFRSSRLNSPTLTVPAAGSVTLTFAHRYSFEADTTRWDGGQLRLSVNDRPYVAVPLARFAANGYNNTVGGVSVPNCELAGQQAFTAQSTGYDIPEYVVSIATLGTFNQGDTISIQFLVAWDDCGQGAVPNWEIDSVQFDPPLEDRRSRPTFSNPALPADAAVVEGRSHTLQVAAVGHTSLQWFKDMDAISGANASTYTIPNMSAADSGQYFVQAANAIGSATSRVATITFIPDTFPPALVFAVLRRDNTVLLSFDEPLDTGWGFDTFNVAVFAQDPNLDNLGVASGTISDGTNVVLELLTQPEPDLPYQIGFRDGIVADLFLNPYVTRLPPNVYQPFPLSRETLLIAINDDPRWRYNDQNIDFQSRTPSVFDVAFDDSSWPLGAALLGRETSATPEPIRTAVSNIPLTTYYRTRFNLSSIPLSLSMRTVVDDGARVFFNGIEVFRSPGMTPMPVPLNFGSFAGRTVDNAVYEGPFDLATGSLVVGENVMAVALHQPAATSSDNLWGCELIAVLGASTAPARITSIVKDAAGHVILEHNGNAMHVQETSALGNPTSATVWTTRPNGPHASPYDAGAANGTRFFRLTNSP
jgi:hypothetical protein